MVGIESTEGVGSRFWYTLRLPLGTAATRPSTANGVMGRNALVVDENPTNRKILDSQLTQLGMHAICAVDSEAAPAQVQRFEEAGRRFDFALIDHQIPDCDGIELGKCLAGRTSLVLLTSAGMRGDAERFAILGFVEYALKPVSERELEKCLQQALSAADYSPATPRSGEPGIALAQGVTHVNSARRGGRILPAEDNVVNQKVARRILEMLGYEVDVVGDGRQAIESWKTGRYALVLTARCPRDAMRTTPWGFATR